MSPLSSDPGKRARQLANLKPAPPAPLGNDRTRRHGGYAAVARDRMEAKVAEVYEALTVDAPLRDNDGGLPSHDALVVRELAEASCLLDDVRAHLRDCGWLDPKSRQPRTAVLDIEDRLSRRALRLAEALGMTPAARGRLGLDLARTAATVDAASALSAARAEPDAGRRAALYRAAGIEVDDAGE